MTKLKTNGSKEWKLDSRKYLQRAGRSIRTRYKVRRKVTDKV